MKPTTQSGVDPNKLTVIPACLDPAPYLNTGHQNTRTPEHLNTRTPEYRVKPNSIAC